MKNLGLFCLLLACFGFESCKKAKDIEAAKVLAETPIRVQCYKALYENDTIELKINTLKNEKITGDMIMSFVDMPKKNGKVVGEFRGDTLFADYSFIQGTEEKTTYKNPVAFLKRGDELILGNG